MYSISTTNLVLNDILFESLPKLFIIFSELSNKSFVFNDDQVFIVVSNSRDSPVERTGDDKLVIDDDILVVHVSLGVVSSGGDSFFSETVDISSDVVSAFIIADDSISFSK